MEQPEIVKLIETDRKQIGGCWGLGSGGNFGGDGKVPCLDWEGGHAIKLYT